MNTNTTKFRPILFSTPMVQALLEGRKTMTRRTKGLEQVNENPNDWNHFHTSPDDKYFNFKHIEHATMEIEDWYRSIKIPYQVGDVFWVRETFIELPGIKFLYKANPEHQSMKWKPSIFMPKEACRIFLKIKSIKVERLQDISEEDAKAEGANPCLNELSMEDRHNNYNNPSNSRFPLVHVVGFKNIWSKINGRSSWNSNPFVFVYEFEQIEKPLDFIL
jgi:hypothetical protein